MEDRTTSIVKNIKNGGSMAIYIGTASIMKPIIREHNQERNGLTKFCSIVSGTVISCGVSHIASKWWGRMVDKVVEFIDDVKHPSKEDGNGKQ